ncbi:MAG TPA: NAD(P)/FAD-dependent oxidoreductase [Candidatus Limnocylindrales bacterium]
MARWAVIGGGVLGLSLAHRLVDRGEDVTLLEAAPELGGLAAAWQLGDVVWDRHYHVILLSDLRTRGMVADAGLDDELHWVETRTGYYGPDNVLRSVSNTLEFLRLPGLNLIDKLRLGGTIFYGSRIRDGRRMEREPVVAWLRRWSGGRTFERFWLPLLRAKLGEAYREASSAFIWATIQRLYAARRTGLKKEMFGYVSGGYAHILSCYAQVLTGKGVAIRTSRPVGAVRPSSDGGLEVHGRDGSIERFDQVIVTAAGGLAADLCPDLTPAEHERLRAVRYMGVVCASLLLKGPLGPYYLTYITDPATPFTAVVEMTAFVDPVEVGGRTLVYLPKYVDPDDPLLAASDDEIRAAFWPYLVRMYPSLHEDDVLAFQVSRVKRVFAIPTIGFSDAMPPMATSIPGLHLVGSAQLPFATLNVNDTLGLVDEFIAGNVA